MLKFCTCTCFLHNNVYKRVLDFFYVDLVLLINLISLCRNQFFLFSQITQARNLCKISTKNFGVVVARQSFQFFIQNTWFLINIIALCKFLCGILHYLISITKLLKESVHKVYLYVNHASHFSSFHDTVLFLYTPDVFWGCSKSTVPWNGLILLVKTQLDWTWLVPDIQIRIQNPVKHPRWSFLRK